MNLIKKPIWWVLSSLGVSKAADLPPIPDAPQQRTPVRLTDPKHVTFSPAKEFIPDYEFGSNNIPNGSRTPTKLIRELTEMCPEQCSEQLMQLAKIVEDLREELADSKIENSRLIRENQILKGEESKEGK
ncbi:Conserved_hypothetical protein [Hexamita inflata]|uniref:Uncharacterized protein n=1 Tax=Hexamita inflata TaxID=28002 RepID=A0AA86RVJ7_9EUKA|nr:Conserved hypothetical protein [Hexamita inflata]